MHLFWSSNEEKRDCVRLSMGGQPWPSSRSVNGGMEGSRERKGREGGTAGVWLGEGEGCRGVPWGSALRSAVPLPFVRLVLLAVRERRQEGGRRKEKGEEKEKEGKEKGKNM
jgi:hypothetical protein